MHRPALFVALILGLGCGPEQEDVPTVTLPVGDRLRLVLVGDSGTYAAADGPCDPTTDDRVIPTPCRDALFGALASESADAALALGDLVYESGPRCGGDLDVGTEARLDDLLGSIQAAADAPLLLALGNHDVHQSSTGKADAEACYRAYAAARESIVFPERNYVVDAGPARMLVLDTNRAPSDALVDALAGALDAQEAPWTVFAAHHVWTTHFDKVGDDHGPRWSGQLGVVPDAWLNGHAHLLQFGEYDGVAAVTSGATAKLRASEPCGGDEGACSGGGLLFNRSRYGYAVVDITADRLDVAFKDVTGAELFTWSRAAVSARTASGR